MTTPTPTLTDAHATAAADAAVGLLPAPAPLTVGTPVREPISVTGQAIGARFTGAAQGRVAVVVGPDLVSALASSPIGALDLTQAVRPALEAAAATLGPVVVDPGEAGEPAEAMQAILDSDGVLVPLTSEDGQVSALVAIAVQAQIGGRPDAVEAVADAAVPAGFGPLDPGGSRTAGQVVRGSLDLLHDVDMEVTAELGRTRMSVRELLSLAPGAVIELDRLAGGPADLLVNGRLIARGEVVVIDENFGIRITEIVSPS
jgi:flagellar motor switch protein FliN/FliY